jgi:hypothetical protein
MHIRSPVGVSGTDIYRHFPAVSGATVTNSTVTNSAVTAMPSRASRNSSMDSTASTHGTTTATTTSSTTAAANTAFITTLMGHHSTSGDAPKGSVSTTSNTTASSRSLSFSSTAAAAGAAAAAAADANTTRTVVCVRVRADGPTKVLEFTEQGGIDDDFIVNSEGVAGAGSRHGAGDAELFRDGVSSHGSSRAAAAAVTQLITANVHSIGISVIDDGPKELLYTYMQGLQVCHTYNYMNHSVCLWYLCDRLLVTAP